MMCGLCGWCVLCGVCVNHMCMYVMSIDCSYSWTIGFSLIVAVCFEIMIGLCIACRYNCSFFSLVCLHLEVYFGVEFHLLHSILASLLFVMIYMHLFRGMLYCSYLFCPLVVVSGFFVLFCFMATAFFGYCLPWSQMSFWGCTVITNLFFALLFYLVSGSLDISLVTLSRFIVFHMMIPWFGVVLCIFHCCFLHCFSSCPLGLVVCSNVMLFPVAVAKDCVVLVSLLFGSLFFGFGLLVTFSDSDCSVSVLSNTPLHIVPEWYFLLFYAVLRCIPVKRCGIVLMIVSLISYSSITISFAFIGYTCHSIMFGLVFFLCVL